VSQVSNAVQRRLAKILRERREPHGKLFKDKEILKGVEISESGIAELWVKPTHPYCPCCINDLIELRKEIASTKGILACHIEIVSIPQSKRWTAAINE
tara:strand:- start:284 stop:577 length:294 start_codon:yes stop_codon:yes gene_type:complete